MEIIAILIISAAVWLGCGIASCGIIIADSYEIWSDYTKKYGDDQWVKIAYPKALREGLLYVIFGPISLLSAWATRWQYRHTHPSKGLRFRP